MPQFEMPPLEEVIMEGVVRRFFEPTITGVTYVQGPFVNGAQQMVPVPVHGEAPLATTVRIMYAEHAKEIAEKVWEKIDVEHLVDQITVRLVKEVLAPEAPANRYSTAVAETPGLRVVVDKVRENVAAELTRRALAKLDGESDDGDAEPRF